MGTHPALIKNQTLWETDLEEALKQHRLQDHPTSLMFSHSQHPRRTLRKRHDFKRQIIYIFTSFDFTVFFAFLLSCSALQHISKHMV